MKLDLNELEKFFNTYTCGPQHWFDAKAIETARTAVPELIAEVRRLREALEWYANSDRYSSYNNPDHRSDRSEVDEDCGERARKALEGK